MSIEGGGSQKTFEQLTVDEKKQNLESVSISNELKEIILISLDETSTQEDFITGAFTDNTEYKSLSAETKRALHEALGIPFTEPKREAIDTKEIPAVITEITTKIPAAKITLEGNTVLLTELQETMETKALQIDGARPRQTKEYKDFLVLVADQITSVRALVNKITAAEERIESLRSESDQLFADEERQSNIQTEDTETIDRAHEEKINTLEDELKIQKENGDILGMLATLEKIAAAENELIAEYQKIIDTNKLSPATSNPVSSPLSSSMPRIMAQPLTGITPPTTRTGGVPGTSVPAGVSNATLTPQQPSARVLQSEARSSTLEALPQLSPEQQQANESVDQLKAHLDMCRERLVRAEYNREKLNSLVGRFKSFLSRPAEASNPEMEYQTAREEYEMAHAWWITRHIGDRIQREREKADLQLDEEFARAETRGRSRKAGIEKGALRKMYDWMGEANLEKVIKPTTRLGKLICKTASVRTLAGLALTGTGIGTAYYGFLGASALALGAKGVMSGFGTYDLLKNVSKSQRMTRGLLYNPGPTAETIPDQVVLNFTNEQLIARVAQFHHTLQSGENNSEFVQNNPMYRQLRNEYMRRIGEARHQTIINSLGHRTQKQNDGKITEEVDSLEALDTHIETAHRAETRDERIRIAVAGLVGASTAVLGWMRADLIGMDAASAASAKTTAEALQSAATTSSPHDARIAVAGGTISLPPNAPPQFSPWTPEINDLKHEALIGKGEGVTHALVRQLDAMKPEQLRKIGFTGNAESHSDLVKFAAKMAQEQGYIDEAHNRQVWVMPQPGEQHYYAIDDTGHIRHIVEDAKGNPLTGVTDVSGRGLMSEGEGWHAIETDHDRWGVAKVTSPDTHTETAIADAQITPAEDMRLSLHSFGADNIKLDKNLSGTFAHRLNGKEMVFGVRNGAIITVNNAPLDHSYSFNDLFAGGNTKTIKAFEVSAQRALEQSQSTSIIPATPTTETSPPANSSGLPADIKEAIEDGTKPATDAVNQNLTEALGMRTTVNYIATEKDLGFEPSLPIRITGTIELAGDGTIVEHLSQSGYEEDMAQALGYPKDYIKVSIENNIFPRTHDLGMYKTMLNNEISELYRWNAIVETISEDTPLKKALNTAIDAKVDFLEREWGLKFPEISQ